MSILDRARVEQKPDDQADPQKAVVAFGAGGVCLVWATDILRRDLEEMGEGGEDVFPPGQGDNPDHGIWVWEGHVVGVVHPSTPDRPEEYDVEYRGEWRPLTDAEWEAVTEQRTPWPNG